MKKLKHYFFPIMFSKDLGKKLVGKTLLEKPIVLARIDGEIFCYENRCPHRNVPLDLGFVERERIICGYHGWEFDKEGTCQLIYGVGKCNSNTKIEKYRVIEEDGIIWVALENSARFENFFGKKEGFTSKISKKSMKADFIHSIENFLDPTHTSFIHKGLLRSEGRQKMKVSQIVSDEFFQTIYNLEDKQNGLINKLFDPGIDINIASFYLPSFAKIEYFKKDELLFFVSIFFVPVDKGKVDMFVSVSLKNGIIPSAIKFLALRGFLELAFKQDKEILEIQYENNQKKNKEYVIESSDLVIEHLLYLFGLGEKKEEKSIEITL